MVEYPPKLAFADYVLFPNFKSPASAGARGNLGMAAATGQKRRLFGPMGRVVQQDFLAATDMEDFESKI